MRAPNKSRRLTPSTRDSRYTPLGNETSNKVKTVAGPEPRSRDNAAAGKPRRTNPNLEPLWETEARSGPKMEARAHVLEAAAKAFMERGYSATTLDEVAALLGTTKGQIYHYYRSKVDLYFDVVVGAFFIVNDKTGPIARQEGVSAVERLRMVAYAHATTVMTTFSFQRVALEATQHQLIAQLSPRQDRAMTRILKFRDEFETMVTALLEEGVQAGEFRVPSVPLAAKAVLGSLNWLTVWFDPKKTKSTQSQDQIARGIAEFVVSGLTTSTLDEALPTWSSEFSTLSDR